MTAFVGCHSRSGDRPKPKNRSDLTFIPEPIQVPKTSPRKISGLPQWVGLFITKIWSDADGRLRGFYSARYIISVVVLAGSGFNELYIAKPTLGANAWGDYFALLVWGFGAEAARNTDTQVLRNTSNPDDSGYVVIRQVAQTPKTEMLVPPQTLSASDSHESHNVRDLASCTTRTTLYR